MVKRIGSILLIIFLFLSSYLEAAEIAMKVLSFDNIELEQAAIGQAFILEVSVKGVSSNTSNRPKIKGLQGFDFGNTGFAMVTENGYTKIKYTYNVVIDKKGQYEIGPAEIEVLGDVIQSNIVKIKIGDKQEEKNGGVKRRKATKKVKLDFYTDKKSVVVGEKVRCTLRFYFLEGEDVEFKDGARGQAKGVRITDQEGAFQGSKKLNGDTYKYLEWKWNVFPTQAGAVTLPANRADFTVRTDKGLLRRFRGFASLLHIGVERKHIYSNAVTLHVEPLLSHKGKVNAVGDFRSFTASVDRAITKQGDGIVLTLEIEGDGDLENLDISELQGMPAALKYYDSKQYIVDEKSKSSVKRKRFEFIVQGLEKGEWQIPKQVFTYFDVKSRDYKMLRTSSIMLKILPQAIAAYKSQKKDEKSDDVVSSDMETDMLRPINKTGLWYAVSRKEIPFPVFIILLLFPLLILLFSWVKSFIFYYSERYAPYRLQKNAFSHASNAIILAARKKDVSVLYSIFMRFFAQRFSLHEANLSQDAIVKILHKKGFSQDEVIAWEQFYAKMTALVFYEKADAEIDKAIFEEASEWIEKFRKRL